MELILEDERMMWYRKGESKMANGAGLTGIAIVVVIILLLIAMGIVF